MSLPNNDPSLPSEAAPIFADTDAGRGDHLRANNQKIWQNLQYLDDGENITDANAATPIDADQLGFWQIAGAIIKKVTFANFFLWLIGKIYALAGKTTPADADQLLITDSAASNAGKSLTLANLFLWVVSKVAALSSKTTPVDADSVLLIDSEASNVGKRFTWANIKTAIFGAINGLTSKPTPVGADVIAIGDSAASFAGKKAALNTLASAITPYAKIVDKKSSGVDGGTFTSGAWQTRTLNLIDTNEAGIVTSLSGNRFTLAAGTYYVSCRAPAFEVYRHKLALYNVKTGNYDLYGESSYDSSGVYGFARLSGIIHTDGTYEYELRHRGQTTATTFGFGVASGFGMDEIYSTVEIFGRSPV